MKNDIREEIELKIYVKRLLLNIRDKCSSVGIKNEKLNISKLNSKN